ncbi:YtxC-like family protein [compost metagenome]
MPVIKLIMRQANDEQIAQIAKALSDHLPISQSGTSITLDTTIISPKIAKEIVKHVVEVYEPLLIEKIGGKYLDDVESVRKLMMGQHENLLLPEIIAMSTQNEHIDIDGFLAFRAQEYKDTLTNVINTVDEKEDSLIIAMEMAELMPNQLASMHVRIHDNEIHLMNINVNDEEVAAASEFSGARTSDFQMLAYFNPSVLFVHVSNEEVNCEVIKSLRQIFRERMTLCEGCTHGVHEFDGTGVGKTI